MLCWQARNLCGSQYCVSLFPPAVKAKVLISRLLIELRNSTLLGVEVLIIGRQVRTAFGGIIDLLGLDREGDLVIVELKRDKTMSKSIRTAFFAFSAVFALYLPEAQAFVSCSQTGAQAHQCTQSFSSSFYQWSEHGGHPGFYVGSTTNKTATWNCSNNSSQAYVACLDNRYQVGMFPITEEFEITCQVVA